MVSQSGSKDPSLISRNKNCIIIMLLPLLLIQSCNIKTEEAVKQYFIPSLNDKNPFSKASGKDSTDDSIISTTPVIGNLSSYLFPLSSSNTAIKAGSTITLTPTFSDPNGDTVASNGWSCTYRTIGLDSTDSNYVASSQNCSLLNSISTVNSVRRVGTIADNNSSAKFNTSTGEFIWTPSFTTSGTFQFNFEVLDSSGETGAKTIYISVMPDFETSTNLSIYLDPSFSLLLATSGYGPRLNNSSDDNTNAWPNLSGTGSNGSLSSFTVATPWAGTNSSASIDPYRLLFAGLDYVDLGTNINSATKISISTWINPTSSSTSGATIISNGDGSSSGFLIRQSPHSSQALEFSIGNFTSTYSSTVLADSPVAYWRLNDSPYGNGSTIADTSGANFCSGTPCNGTLTDFLGTAVTGVTGGLVGETNTAIKLYWGDYITAPWIFNPRTTDWTSEIWLKADFNNTNFYYSALALTMGTGGQSEFLLAENTDGWQLYSQFGGVKQFVGITPKENVWYHIVQTYNNTTDEYKWYVNGVLTSSGTMVPYNNTDGNFIIGTVSWLQNSPVWQGPMHDVALYNTVLTETQIQRHYYAGARCRGTTKLENNTWNHLAANFDGTTTTLLVNGQVECKGNPGTNPSGSTQNLVIGRKAVTNNNYWSGQIGPISISTSSDGSATTSFNNLLKDFYRTFDGFKSQKMSDIVRSNLILHWDANLAKNGSTSFTNTCDQNTTSWADISGHGNIGTSGSFATAGGCDATHGWNGSGTTGDPYRVRLTGQSHIFNVDHMISTNKTYTFEFWFRSSSTATYQWLFDSPNLSLYYSDGTNVGGQIGYRDITYTATPSDNKDITPAYSDGVWHHIVFVLDSTAGTGTVYVDGTSMGSGAYTGRDITGNAIGFFGRQSNSSWGFYNADVAIVRVYEKALTNAEIKQNCHTQVSRFSGATCAAP